MKSLTKSEKQRYMTKKPVGTLQLTQSDGIVLLAIENSDGEDTVISAFTNGKEYDSITRSKINYPATGEPFFRKKNRTYKLSEFMKVENRL